jgi:hypothetical protein
MRVVRLGAAAAARHGRVSWSDWFDSISSSSSSSSSKSKHGESMERIPRFAILGAAADAQIDRYRYPLYKRLLIDMQGLAVFADIAYMIQ